MKRPQLTQEIIDRHYPENSSELVAEQKRDRQEIEETSLHRAAQLAAEEIVRSIMTVEPTNRINDARRFAEIIYRNVRNQREL